MKHEFDESRLTAYVLGELEEADRQEVETQLEASPELRAEVEEIRRTVDFISTEFASEEPAALTDSQRDAIESNAGVRKVRFPARYRWFAAAAAACVLVAVTIHWESPVIPPPEVVQGPAPQPDGLKTPVEPQPATPEQVVTEAARTLSQVDAKTGEEGEKAAGLTPTERKDLNSAVDKEITSLKQALENDPDQTDAMEYLTLMYKEKAELAGNADEKKQWEREADVMALSALRTNQEDARTAKQDGRQIARSDPSLSLLMGRVIPASPPQVRTAPAYTLEEYNEFAPDIGNVPAEGQTQVGQAGRVGGIAAPMKAKGEVMMRELAMRVDTPAAPVVDRDFNTEAYDRIQENPFIRVSQDPLSTFSIDVDTASYANIRRFLNDRTMPPKDAVRIEELVNYFSYDYQPPTGSVPFAVHLDTAAAPWSPRHQLVRIGLKGREIPFEERKPTNLVFLLDVSGSMQPENKLPLLKRSLRLLVDKLGENDRVAMVVYAGASGLALPSTSCSQKEAILQALDQLEAGGSTNGASGIQLAYQVAEENFIKNGINRVILATDGDFNVGVTNQGDLTRLIEEKAKSGVFLTVLGFGMGNLKDSSLEKLADKGNGNYGYVDSLQEARKLLVDQIGGTLITIAKDVKIQIEFNPARVEAYRLIGYENRMLRHQDFNDDTKDAGEIGAGLTVTALYEVVPKGVEIDIPGVDPLKYQKPAGPSESRNSPELLTVKLRYKEPAEDTSKLLEFSLRASGRSFDQASTDFRFAASVASFGMLLRDSEYRGESTYDRTLTMAEGSLGSDSQGYRKEFVNLVKKARALSELEGLE